MKKLLLSTLALVLIISCSTSKQIERSVSAGNYDQAINNAIGKLRTNKNKKRKAEYIVMLQEAYAKANQRDVENINFLNKDSNPENFIKVYDLYVALDNRQNRIKPLLPLYVNEQEVKLPIKDYASAIITSKDRASLQLYTNAKAVLNQTSNTKLDYRFAYEQFKDIEDIFSIVTI